MPINKHRTAVVASAIGLSLGGGAIASAATQSGSSTTPSTTTQSAPRAHPNEQALTGDTADKVRAAALAKLPGATVLRVETDEGGVYEAHVRKADGTEAEVHVDKDYNVTSVDTRPAGGGHGGHDVDTAALAKALGVTEAQLTAALDKVKPTQADHAAHPDKGARDTELASALAKELGLDAAKVKAALDAQHPNHP